jgi:hypothetical protein
MAKKVAHRAKTAKKQPKKVAKAVKKTKISKKRDVMVVQSPVDPKVQFMIASEFADDEIIEAELVQRTMPYYVYSFPQDGKEVTGLSVKGVNETVRLLNRNKKSGYKIRIRPDSLIIERDVVMDNQKGVQVSVYAENLIDGNGGWGIKFEPYMKARKRGGTYKDNFALEKALSKAERNAKRKLIPEQTVIEMIKQLAKKPENVMHIEAPATVREVDVYEQPQKTSREEVLRKFLVAVSNAKRKKDVRSLRMIKDNLLASDTYDDEFKSKVVSEVHNALLSLGEEI